MQEHSKNSTKPPRTHETGSDSGALSGSIETKPSLDNLKRKAADDLDTVREKAKAQVRNVAGKAEEVASEQKNIAARYAASLGSALQKVGTEMQKSDDATVGRYAKELGSTVQSFAKNIENRKLGDMAGMAEDFGRKQPLAFLGMAALAGLAASRFLTASAQKRPTSTATSNLRSDNSSSTHGGQR
jgi:hypothetical protein